MNTKRIIFWAIFVVVLVLIIWGVIVSIGRQQSGPAGQKVGTPAPVATTDHVRVFPPSAVAASTTPAVTLIEYSDFQCPACEAYYPVVEHLLASTTIPIRFVYRHFPLPQHPNAKPAIYAAEAAGLQGKYWQMHDLLFTYHAQWTELGDPTDIFVGYAQRLGMNVPKFKADMASDAVKSIADAHLAASQKLGLFQTPTFFVNGTMIQNPQSYDEFTSDIQKAAR